jgi:hypothetical protein
MKLLIVLALVVGFGAGFWIGKAAYQVKLTPGQCLDAATQSVGQSIDNFISNIKG